MKNQNWICGGDACDSPLFRRSFKVSNPTQAHLEICGLGFFLLYVNGRRVGEDEFVPALTNYGSVLGCRATYPVWEERGGFRVCYLAYDLLPYLRQGENVLAVQLGNGWYHQTRRQAEGAFVFGTPKVRFELTVTESDGSRVRVESDCDTLWHPSEILENNLYYGEEHDLRRLSAERCVPGESADGWLPARKADPPQALLVPQDCPTDRVIRTLQPRLILLTDERRLYDCGENITGWVNIRCSGHAGEQVRVRHSENLTADRNALDFASAGGEEQIQENRYICADVPMTVRPKFSWQAFRYFEVTGPGEPEEVAVVHADIPVTASFVCSDPVLNWLFSAYIRTQLNNMHSGVPSDCPHRERLGYTGDGQVTAETAMLTLGSERIRRFYTKWMQDILDSRGAETGHIPHTAPFLGGGGGPGGWGGAVFVIPMAFYRVYGDTDLLRLCYPHILRWLEYLHRHSENGLVTREEEGGWCLGDWCFPAAEETIPSAFVNTYFHIKALHCVESAAPLLGEPVPVWLPGRIATVEEAFRNAFYDPQTGSFCRGLNGADAFALDLGLGNEKTRASLLEKYRSGRTLDTGIFGTPLLLEMLFRMGEASLAFELLTGRTDTSFARMKEAGATTLWETWDGGASHDHPMFGGAVRLLFTEILGIRQKPGSTGYTDYEIEPADIPALKWARGSVRIGNRVIRVNWKRTRSGALSVRQRCDRVHD